LQALRALRFNKLEEFVLALAAKLPQEKNKRLNFMLLMMKHAELAHWARSMKVDASGQLVPKQAAVPKEAALDVLPGPAERMQVGVLASHH
jgi:hypothetical protein